MNSDDETPVADEIAAASAVIAALDALDEQARSRILRWAMERYGVRGRLGAA